MSRTTFLSAVVCALALGCSSSTTAADGPPDGAVPIAHPLKGCSPLEPGCYTASGAYTHPAVSASCSNPGGPVDGSEDEHCTGVAPQVVNPSSCTATRAASDAGPAEAGADAGLADADLEAGPCGENSGDYGATMFGQDGDDDDCKYHVHYEATPLCQADGEYFTVQANYLARGGSALTGACTWAEVCLNDTHPAPTSDYRPPVGKQLVVEGPPGTYTVGPVVFDAPGDWTVRFHFNEQCCDVSHDSPHGHAAFHLSVP